MDTMPKFNRRRGYGRGGGRGGGCRGGRGGRGGRGRGGHPPGLQGRDIGLWYAKKSRQNREQMLNHGGGTIDMNSDQFANATEAIKASEMNAADSPSHMHSQFHQRRVCSSGSSYWYENEHCSTSDDASVDPVERETPKSLEHAKLLAFRKKLPVFQFQKQIVDHVNDNQVMVITGETGCGKTTQIPQYILDNAIEQGQSCRIVCTQPRRISAIAVAERVSVERNEDCGDGNSCGYQIKLQSRFPRRHNSILYCTTGILIRVLRSDPLLSTLTHVVLDEIHERDIQSDFLITIIKRIISKRKDLKVILMSATLNAEVFSTYFNNCPMFHVPGFTYPVTEYHLEETLAMTKFKLTQEMRDNFRRLSLQKSRGYRGRRGKETEAYVEELEAYKKSLRTQYSDDMCDGICCVDAFSQSKIAFDLIVHIIKHIVTNMSRPKSEYGAILVFLPGWADIKMLHNLLTDDFFFQPDRYRIIPLHSMMPTTQQKQIFSRPPPGVTKIVIATNIAETSITIDDVVYVIDGGKIKIKDFQHENDLQTLLPSWETKANAKQRSGRAGRVQNGYCFRLYTKLQESKLEEFIVPEIIRTPLDQVCLQIKLLRLGIIREFLSQVLDSPAEDSVNLSLEKLSALNALDNDENLTSLGYHLAQLPVEPQIGKMLLFGAIFSCLDPILTIAACLSFKDPFVIPLGKEKQADDERRRLARGMKSDHLMFANVFRDWQKECRTSASAGYDFCRRHFLSPNNLKMIRDMRLQFAEYLHNCGFLSSNSPSHPSSNRSSENLKVVLAVVCSGLYPNIARVIKRSSHKPPGFNTKTDRKVYLHPKSVNSDACSGDFQYDWLCYYEKVKTNQVNLYDSSEASPYSLLFFGGDIKPFTDENNVDRISVDHWIRFHAAPDIANTVKRLRFELDKLLEMKVKHPKWKWDSAQISILDSIVDLISQN